MAIAACMMTLGAQAQVKNNDAFDVVEEMPVFPGGMQGMINFLSENISYPKDAQEKKIVTCNWCSMIVRKKEENERDTRIRL